MGSMTSATNRSRCLIQKGSNYGWRYGLCFRRSREIFSCATACCSSSLYPGDERQVVLQPVDASFHEAPLNVALQKLSDLTGVSVVLDARTAEKTQVAVTAELNNVPLLDAVRVLSDMAGLRPVALDNVLYVTTPDERESRWRQTRRHIPGPRALELVIAGL